jgi:hypothetical protein
MRQLAGVFLAVSLFVSAADAQSQMVRVTVPKANVRSEPTDKAPILQQATPKDQIEWRATEGDWFKVLMPPNPALGGARVEAYISKKVAKLEAAPAMPASTAAGAPAAKPAEPEPPRIDTHTANVFLGSIVDGTLLRQVAVQIAPSGNRMAWTIQKPGDWNATAEHTPAFVVSIGDRAGFSPMGLAPAIVRLSAPPNGLPGQLVGSTKTDSKDWKSDEISTEMTEGTPGVWNVKPSKDLKPGDYAIIMRPSSSTVRQPEIAWAFTVK